MAAERPGRERELCPHCRRPFQRLRAHLPYCKAAPSAGQGPGFGPGPGPGPAAARAPRPRAGPAQGRGPDSGSAGPQAAAPPESSAQPGGRGKKAAGGQAGAGSGPGGQADGRRAERHVAECLDLLPEEVKGLPEELSGGVEIVIEKHRAKVLRRKSGRGTHGSAAEGPGPGRPPGPAAAARPDPPEGKAAPGTAAADTRGRGVAKKAAASSKGGKNSRLEASETPTPRDPPGAECRSSPTDLLQREARDKTVTEEKQMHVEAGVEYKAPLSALHTKNLHLSAAEAFAGHKEGTSNNDLSSLQRLREREQQMAAASEPILNAGRDRELALHPVLLHTSICLSQASVGSAPARALGLEWFPDLYPNYHRLNVFPRKPFQEEVGITTETPKSSFAEGQRGPLSERRLLDVRLGELPTWLATRDFSPRGLLGGVQRAAWSSYSAKYIHVKQGGPAGISMLLAGFCLLSYSWSYQHIKCHRWRKYH